MSDWCQEKTPLKDLFRNHLLLGNGLVWVRQDSQTSLQYVRTCVWDVCTCVCMRLCVRTRTWWSLSNCEEITEAEGTMSGCSLVRKSYFIVIAVLFIVWHLLFVASFVILSRLRPCRRSDGGNNGHLCVVVTMLGMQQIVSGRVACVWMKQSLTNWVQEITGLNSLNTQQADIIPDVDVCMLKLATRIRYLWNQILSAILELPDDGSVGRSPWLRRILECHKGEARRRLVVLTLFL